MLIFIRLILFFNHFIKTKVFDIFLKNFSQKKKKLDSIWLNYSICFCYIKEFIQNKIYNPNIESILFLLQLIIFQKSNPFIKKQKNASNHFNIFHSLIKFWQNANRYVIRHMIFSIWPNFYKKTLKYEDTYGVCKIWMNFQYFSLNLFF